MTRWMLLPFWVLALAMGLGYLLGGPERTAAPAFGAAKAIMPIQAWGVMFLLGALAIGVNSLINRRRGVARALLLGGAIYLWWGVLFGIAAVNDPRASLNGFWVYAFIAFCHWLAKYRVITEKKMHDRAFQAALKELQGR